MGKIKKLFYVFLDISGILLGIFLVWLGWQIIKGAGLPDEIGIITLVLGICAFLIHLGHYYKWKLREWILGPADYFEIKKKS